MKNLTPILFLFIYLIVFLPAEADDFTTATISATASVIPSVGLMPHSIGSTAGLSSNNILEIQTLKNSTLILHIQTKDSSRYLHINHNSSHAKDAVADIITIDIQKYSINLTTSVLTIIPSEN